MEKNKKLLVNKKFNTSDFSYIYRGCKALYCQKCVKVLTDMENICWACDKPLDQSKPIKLEKNVFSEELEIEQEPHKGEEKLKLKNRK